MSSETATSQTGSAGVPPELRAKLALALDVDDLVAAGRLARDLRPYFGIAKVGLELYSAAGPEAIGVLHDLGFRVFCDLKLHDIPTTVAKATRVLGALGVDMVTMHAHGGVTMLSAGVTGLREGAARAGLPEPLALAVTVLTSDADAPDHILPMRVRIALEAGCDGLVCAARDLKDVREYGPRLVKVVPGIRGAGGETHDQPKAVTPSEALEAGADVLVIGRAVTAADEPVAAAAALLDGLS